MHESLALKALSLSELESLHSGSIGFALFLETFGFQSLAANHGPERGFNFARELCDASAGRGWEACIGTETGASSHLGGLTIRVTVILLSELIILPELRSCWTSPLVRLFVWSAAVEVVILSLAWDTARNPFVIRMLAIDVTTGGVAVVFVFGSKEWHTIVFLKRNVCVK
jgi:energy-converting hydrogenase Eha subunit E